MEDSSLYDQGNTITHVFHKIGNTKQLQLSEVQSPIHISHQVSTSNEQIVFDLLSEMDNVENVEKDHSNSKFDIYYTLKGENVKRGLQVKSMCLIRSETFVMADMNKYPSGMLIVCLNYQYQIGLAYLYSSKYNNMEKIYVMLKKSPRTKFGEFNKMLMYWEDFVVHLKQMLSKGIIVTPEIFKNSMSSSNFLEYESIARFSLFCEKYGWDLKINDDNFSPTDLFVNNYKVQMKYVSGRTNPTHGHQQYQISLNRNFNSKTNKTQPYKKGDNDFYIIELGGYHGEYLIIPEEILIKYGFISSENTNGKFVLGVYHYDYVDKKLPTTLDIHKSKVKGNWTCDKQYWVSTDKGPLEPGRGRLPKSPFPTTRLY
jgi:hypothetical protein